MCLWNMPGWKTPALCTALLNGDHGNVIDTCGSINLSTTTAPGNLNFGSSADTDCDTPGTGGGAGNTYAARSAFWHATLMRNRAEAYLPSLPWLNSSVTISTNIASDADTNCTAWRNGNTINFLQLYGDCNNSSEVAGLVDHEWAHVLDSNDGGPAHVPSDETASGEAYGDFADVLMSKIPCFAQSIENIGTCYHCPAWCHGKR